MRNNEFAVARNFWISRSIRSTRSHPHSFLALHGPRFLPSSPIPLSFPFLPPTLPLAPRQPSGAVRRRRGRWLGGVARLDGGGGRRRRGAEARRAARRGGAAQLAEGRRWDPRRRRRALASPPVGWRWGGGAAGRGRICGGAAPPSGSAAALGSSAPGRPAQRAGDGGGGEERRRRSKPVVGRRRRRRVFFSFIFYNLNKKFLPSIFLMYFFSIDFCTNFFWLIFFLSLQIFFHLSQFFS